MTTPNQLAGVKLALVRARKLARTRQQCLQNCVGDREAGRPEDPQLIGRASKPWVFPHSDYPRDTREKRNR
jgi:hypothetical protein